MKWTISDKPSSSKALNLDLTIDPPDLIAQVFFINTDVSLYPALLHDAVVEKLFGNGMMGVKFYNDLDAEDFANKHIFKEDEVAISHQLWGRTLINKQVFFEILYEYAGKLLLLHRNNTELQKSYTQWIGWDEEYNFLNPKWALAIEEGLASLKAKISGPGGSILP